MRLPTPPEQVPQERRSQIKRLQIHAEMREVEFWKLIEEARLTARGDINVPRQLIDSLKEMPPSEIVEFEEIFHTAYSRAFDSRLWAAATLVLRYCSDDVFYDFRGLRLLGLLGEAVPT